MHDGKSSVQFLECTLSYGYMELLKMLAVLAALKALSDDRANRYSRQCQLLTGYFDSLMLANLTLASQWLHYIYRERELDVFLYLYFILYYFGWNMRHLANMYLANSYH